MGFYSESFRFEGCGGRQTDRGRIIWKIGRFWKELAFNHPQSIFLIVGLNRTGKSCRLRWVNYLHPGLKRGKMTPQEERLVLELHAKWGNRWSRIARKLPGRTDNEIKNYWRTHTRKKAQEKKRAMSPSSSSSSSTTTTVDTLPFPGKASFYDTGGADMVSLAAGKKIINSPEFEDDKGYSMDDIWKDIDLSEENMQIKPLQSDNYNYSTTQEGGCCNFSCPPPPTPPFMAAAANSPSWDFCWDSLQWKMDEEESKIFLPNNQFLSCFEYGRESITG